MANVINGVVVNGVPYDLPSGGSGVSIPYYNDEAALDNDFNNLPDDSYAACPDDDEVALSANMVDYDNTQSGSEATSVQAAIDEDKADIAQIKDDLTNITKIVETPTINVQTASLITGSVPAESGYKAIGIVGYIRNNATDLPYISYIHIDNQTYNLAFANAVGDVKLKLLYVKE